MTIDDLAAAEKAVNDFWLAFSKLCNAHIEKAPQELRDYYAMRFGEKTSIYGRHK